MNSKMISPRFLMLTTMVLVAAFTRLIPHYPNFTAIGAMALFGGAYYSNKKLAFVVPFAAMFLTDLFLGFHSTIYAVYISFAAIVLIGFSLRGKVKTGNIVMASISASVLFFLVTNFAVWAAGIYYPTTSVGLAACFTAAIPFFASTLLGNLFFAGVLFGAFELAQIKFPVLVKVKA